jgi:hypothetical protein
VTAWEVTFESLRENYKKTQTSPLRYAPVEMTILFEHSIPCFPREVRGTADPSAWLGMTKERVPFSWKVVDGQKTSDGELLVVDWF